MIRYLAVVIAAAIAAHLIFGWMFSVGGAVLGGYMAGKNGWIVGGLGLLISWGAFIIYDLIKATSEVMEMARVVAAILGEWSPFATFTLTLIIGGVLGALGGLVGSALAELRVNAK